MSTTFSDDLAPILTTPPIYQSFLLLSSTCIICIIVNLHLTKTGFQLYSVLIIILHPHHHLLLIFFLSFISLFLPFCFFSCSDCVFLISNVCTRITSLRNRKAYWSEIESEEKILCHRWELSPWSSTFRAAALI